MSDIRVVREADVTPESWSDPIRGEVSFRTLLGSAQPPGAFTAGVADLQPGGWLGHHRHEPAEIYYVLSGVGTVTIDGEDHPASAGSVVYIPANSEHGIRNHGDSPLRFFYAFAVGSFEGIEYRFTAEP